MSSKINIVSAENYYYSIRTPPSINNKTTLLQKPSLCISLTPPSSALSRSLPLATPPRSHPLEVQCLLPHPPSPIPEKHNTLCSLYIPAKDYTSLTLNFHSSIDDSEQLQARAGGGIGDILKDHVKYTTNPPTALEPIPAEDNNALRETHRQAHKTILDVMTGGAAGKAGNKAGNDAADKGGDKADKADKADKGDKAAA